MNPIFQNDYNDITVSVITTNNKVVDQDITFITNKKQILKFGQKLLISIEGDTVERVEMEQKLQEFMQSSIFYPMLIRAFFSDTILTWDDLKKISVNENANDVYIILMDIVVSLKDQFKNRNLTSNEKILSSLNILATVFPDEDYDFREIFPLKNKNTESLLLIWNQIQEMLHNIFETFYSCFSEIVKNKSAEDFQFGKYEDYLNLKLDQETVKIGFYKHCYQEIIKKSLDICFDISDYIDFKSSEFVDEITTYQKFLDQDYSDITILADIFPSIIKKIRHISSGDAVKEVEQKEISDLKDYLRELLSSDILNHNLWISIEQILNDDLFEGMLDDFLDDSDCKDKDWTDKQYSCYTVDIFNPEFKVYRHKLSNKILNHYCPLVYCANGFKYGDCTHATSNERTCPFLHCEGFRLNIYEKYVVLTEDLENETDGRIFYSEGIAAKIFEAVRTNFPEHDKIYQLCKNGRNTLYLYEGRIGEHTYVYTVPPRESQVVNSPLEITCNDSSENDNSLDNSFNELSLETQQDVNSTSGTQQENVNSTSGHQQEVVTTTSVMPTGLNISFFGDDSDNESEDEDNTCQPEQIVNVWNTSERLPTIIEKDEEVDVQDEVPDQNLSIVSEVPSTLESIKENGSIVSSSSTKNNSVPFIFFEQTKVFFNKPKQRLISDNSLVEVLEYAGNNMVKCKAGNEIIICDPLEEFVNFKKFAEICNKKYLKRKEKMNPKKETVKKNIPLGKVVTKDNSFLSVVSNSSGKSTSSVVPSCNEVSYDKENSKDFPSLEASKDIPQKKNVYCIPVSNILPNLNRPNLNPCSHFLSKGFCEYDKYCQFDHVVFCKHFYTYGICNNDCGNYHPEELKKLVEDMDINRILGPSGEFYNYWKKLYIPEICRAKYLPDCKYKNCRRFHFKSTK